MGEGGRSERIEYLDVLRIASMCCVVLLHTFADSLRSNYGSYLWHFSNLLTSLASAAVPVFFMISGAALFASSKSASIGYTLRHRLPKLVVPLLAWTVIALVYFSPVGPARARNPVWSVVVDRLIALPQSPVTIHLWFLYTLIPLYVLSPPLKVFVDRASRDLVLYLFVLWLLFASLLPTIAMFLPARYHSLAVIGVPIRLNSLVGYVGYFVAGYYLWRLKARVSLKLIIPMVVGSLLVIVIGTAHYSGSGTGYSEVLKTYTGFFVVVLSFGLFLLVKEWFRERQLGKMGVKVVAFVTPVTFGVYLGHVFVIDLSSRLLHWSPPKDLWVLCVAYLLILGTTILGAWVLTLIRPFSFILTGQRYRRQL